MITSDLSSKFNTRIEIDRVDYHFFNRIQIEGFYLEDQSKDTLLYVKNLNAGFEFWQFFKKKIVFSDFDMDNCFVNIKTDAEGKTNFAFLFRNKKNRQDSAMIDLRIDRLKISNSEFDYTNSTDTLPHRSFNPGHIRVKELNTEIMINAFNKDTISASVNYMNAYETSGFRLDNLRFSVLGSPRGVKIPELYVQLPESDIRLKRLSLTTKSYDDLLDFRNKVAFSIPISNTRITLSDLKALVPGFAKSHEALNLNALISGTLSSLHFHNVKVQYGKSFVFDAQLDVNGLPNISESFIYGQVNTLQIAKAELQDLIAGLQNRPFVLPSEFDRLGMITYRGNITGFLTDIVAYGNLSTNLGNIASDISLKLDNDLKDLAYNGNLHTTGFDLGKLLNDTAFGKVSANLNTTGTKKYKQPLKGVITAQLAELAFNNYNYKNAEFDGKYDGNGFNGEIEIKDENIEADFKGIIDFKNPKIPVLDFDLTVNNTDLHALNLIKDYPGARLSFHGKTNMSGSNLDNLNGYVRFENILFSNKDKTLNSNEVIFTSRTDPGHTYVSIRSDYINGIFSGDFKYSSIGNTFNKIIAAYLPSLSEKTKKPNGNQANKINIDLSIDNTLEIAKVLEIPYEMEGIASINGKIDESVNKIEFTARVPSLKGEKQIFENVTVRLENNNKQLEFTARAQMHDKHADMLNMFLHATAANDDLGAKFVWQNNKETTNAGEIDTRTSFSRVNNALQVQTRFNPTQIIISDETWDLHASDICFNSDSLVTVNNFMFENQHQYININGSASAYKTDSMIVKMNDIDLGYVMQLLRLKGINMGGIVTGEISLFRLLKEPIFLADLNIIDFSLNDRVISDAKLTSDWDNTNKRLVLNGDFFDKEKKHVASGIGYFIPKNDSLDIKINAEKVSAEFLNRYFDGVASNFSGTANGDLRIYGPTKHLLFDGDLMVNNGKVTIDMLKTTYTFNDRVRLTPKRIGLNYIKLYDEEKNQAVLNGYIDHNGIFSEMRYDIKISSDNILAMNTKSTDGEFFYGKAYVGGLVRIYGDEDEANIVVNGISKPKTKCFMSMGSASTVLESDFIRFAQKHINTYVQEINETRRTFANESEFNVKVDMQIEVTPEAEMDILVDPVAGDKITGSGRGNLRVVFDTFSDVELYGTVELTQGFYLFTLQTVIRKEFRINEGSTITWAGNPFDARVNINGYYPLTASLTDLIEKEELQQLTSRSTVPVQCLLYLTDNLMSPTIKFGIDLPSSDETIKSRVRSVINTDEMMNRQILYLLLFHKFFTPDYMRPTENTALGINEGLSFAAATASAQINNWIQSALNSNVISFGVDWQKTDVQSDEIKAQVLIQPNNRLIINGNIGYRNDNISENKLIGDFDLEYKLVESGKLRFTAYNHTIDKVQLRDARFTQGVGLIYREDFNNMGELFEYYWQVFKKIFTKKEKKK